MTTAHRPTFDPARGKDALRGPAYHQRLLPAHTQLKVRRPGQGDANDVSRRDLRAQLLEAESVHFSKVQNGAADAASNAEQTPKRSLEAPELDAEEAIEDFDAKRRRILAETRQIDADSDGSTSDSEDDSDDDDEDETAELMRELEKIKRERAEQRAKEEQERAAAEQEQREKDIALGNPLLNPTTDYAVNRRWDDDVIFKNQARGTEDKRKAEFVNDLLRSDFHKKFMSKYVQ